MPASTAHRAATSAAEPSSYLSIIFEGLWIVLQATLELWVYSVVILPFILSSRRFAAFYENEFR